MLSQDKTTILISHRITTLKDSDYIIVLDEGNIIEEGTHLELIDQKGFYYKMSMIQKNSS